MVNDTALTDTVGARVRRVRRVRVRVSVSVGVRMRMGVRVEGGC